MTAAERSFVEEQLSQGKTVTIHPPSNVSGERTADFDIDGETVELKTVSNATPTSDAISSRISQQIRSAAGQTDDVVVIDARGQPGVSENIAERALDRIRAAFKSRSKILPRRIEILTPTGKIVY